jgi:GNAT superfamily N-acetyltransferase
MRLAVRAADVGDAPAIAALAEAAARATYAPIAQAAVYEAFIAQTSTASSITAAVDRARGDAAGYFLVAVGDGAEPILGFLDFGTDDDGQLELRRLYTKVGQTSRGVGSLLLAELESHLAPGTSYRAIAHARNQRGLSFWQRHGFIVEDELGTREHLAVHRGLAFEAAAEPEPSLVLRRVVDERAR